ncbi:MAG: DUF423 domain-containing protein [Xanthomonadales bacterium]|nr:DUF423 domain-containing protein [Xanthomonadales bacterium]NIN58236.1 DUF423 domain-containing protein [Xanthomonadales bacterium]NIN73588.1 DUF423 domain-containing protein [Xanthomonadales bacterium]NIO13703.1 DUF423 domain-containing protein [Xanthomonadales bacterium]NIP10629.1 DUF423 domain-containing protein [Xanthomonadales bacterium]
MSGARLTALLGGLLGLSGVALAAVGSHLVASGAHAQDERSWQAAILIQLVHAAALLGLAGLSLLRPSRTLTAAAIAMALGVALFSGSLYLAVAQPHWDLPATAPTGGLLLMAAWALAILAMLRAPRH